MAGLDRDTLTDVLRVARDHGYRYVRIKSGRHSFEADLPEPDTQEPDEAPNVVLETPSSVESERMLTAPVVGYYRQPDPPLTVGAKIKTGQVVGEVLALGIANDVVSDVEGEVTEVLVEDGAALEYGQALAKVKSP
ncbi:MAG: hypothetical protein JST30_04345 [Armatimonadetes bacterium]|nr:hypothetical protein [Armatimonadota bacterium]